VNETDEGLVGKSQRQDRAAFEELVRRTARLVFSRIYLETGDAHRTEDLVQETFLVAWRSIAQVTDAGGFRAWLLSIARSVTVDAQRREGRRKRAAPPGSRGTRLQAEALLQLAAAGDDPLEAAQVQEDRQRVLSVLRSLPTEYREPLMLRYLGGADYETISQQLGLTNGSLRGLLHRGMARMRAQLSEGITAEDLPRRRRGAEKSG